MHIIKKIFISALFISIFFISCSLPVTKVTVQSFEVSKEAEKEQAINSVMNILVDRGYDIKLSDKEAGILTTEFNKYASLGDNPPFDYFIQIKVTVRHDDDKLSLKLIPLIKEQNRLNSAAFTKHELSYYEGDPKHIRLIDSMKEETGWRKLAQIKFMNVVTDVAEFFNMDVADVTQNITKTEANAFSAK